MKGWRASRLALDQDRAQAVLDQAAIIVGQTIAHPQYIIVDAGHCIAAQLVDHAPVKWWFWFCVADLERPGICVEWKRQQAPRLTSACLSSISGAYIVQDGSKFFNGLLVHAGRQVQQVGDFLRFLETTIP